MTETDSISQETITSYNTLLTVTNGVPESSDSESNDQPQEEEEPPNDDPLSIKQLALNVDYLLYKINDRYRSLSAQALSSTERLKENTEITIMEIDKIIQRYYEISKELENLNNDFSKLEQLEYIVDEFVPRVKSLMEYFG